MIRKSFIFLPGISKKTEENIWKQGITSWDSFIKSDIKGISKKRKHLYNTQLLYARSNLYSFNSSYFNTLPTTQTWRLYDFFRGDIVFLDIEATGVNKQNDITVVGLFDGIDTKTMIKGVNLDFKVLKKELEKYKLIITFNGSSFDLPFIKKRYDILPDIPHIDLRHLCAKVGLTGGLKEIEKKLGIKRNRIVDNMHGGDPLTLWKMYRGSGDAYYLEVLVEYNEEDVINLKKIMEYCYKKITSSHMSLLHHSESQVLHPLL
ncbi:ribonuclease H-like domain-containing protein [Desulfosarcina sp.]|nr:ribonuclease H-like domain-containing protein [Desulfosarcina sp.]